MSWIRWGTANSLSPTVIDVLSPSVVKKVPSKPRARFMTVAVGDLRPQPSPYVSPLVSDLASAANSSHVIVSPVGTATPAASKTSVLAKTTYDWSSVGAAMIAPSGVDTVAQMSSDTQIG